ncbi:HesA/MoeB/ThiF family protein [Deinococcus roseus]|uniref:Molybdopterin biosynthesis protein MoeB n=1 Tax=Deinococcus roseus TaxID=392414 RepID=A0ABQ2CX84_9DEIO|nr:HesA/MoeB/ThiF family protein [Deinococcus roseus]GGJ25073.1 molybdopterin biosynthesis protein MoeB [Deinococcus roseus]
MLTRPEIQRYSRQLLLDGFTPEHQQKLTDTSVLFIGAGGLGTPAMTYLAAAGVGHIGICDFDTVSISNLQRQVLYRSADVDAPKARVAASQIQQLNPRIKTEILPRLTPENAEDLFSRFDLVLDCADNFATRYLVNDTCVKLGKTWVWAAAQSYEAMLSVFTPERSLRRIFPDPPPSQDNCDTIGVIGPMLGVAGSMMALEALKVITGLGTPLIGKLWTFDALAGTARVIKLP